MNGGTTIGKVKTDGTVYYINIGYMNVEDVFNDDLVTSTDMWHRICEYKFCPVGEFFLPEKFKDDKTLWRILVDLDGSIQIRQDELNGAPKPEILTSPTAESLDISGVPNIVIERGTLDVPPASVSSITLDVPAASVSSITLDVPPASVSSITLDVSPVTDIPEIPTIVRVRRSFWSRFLCSDVNVA
jgi:hypothetical protein